MLLFIIFFPNLITPISHRITPRHQPKDEELFVKHMHLNNWPDYGVPKDPRSMLRTMDFIRDFNRGDDKRPLLVHCSAGIGRTGIILAVAIGTEEIVNKGKTDLTSIVTRMRKDRGGMLQTFEQYEFAYKYVSKGGLKCHVREGRIVGKKRKGGVEGDKERAREIDRE